MFQVFRASYLELNPLLAFLASPALLVHEKMLKDDYVFSGHISIARMLTFL